MVVQQTPAISIAMGTVGTTLTLAASGTGAMVPICLVILGLTGYEVLKLIMKTQKQKRKQKKY